MSKEQSVKIRGERELLAALKQSDTDLPKEVRLAFREIAVDIAGKVAAKVPKVTGKAAGSIKPRATQRGGSVAGGGQRVPYYQWLEFGGDAGPHKSIHRPYIRTGRYLYPTVYEEREHTLDAVTDALARVIDKAGL